VLVQIGDSHVGAFARKEDGYGTADARIPASDERHHVLELVRPLVVRGVVHWLKVELRFDARLRKVLARERRGRIDPGPHLQSF
jgi:hypothetical protein